MPRAELDDILIPGESPYYAMFRAGCLGYTIDEVEDHCQAVGIPLRAKDIRNWQDGHFKNEVRQKLYEQAKKSHPFDPIIRLNGEKMTIAERKAKHALRGPELEEIKFEDLPKLPDGWVGTHRRFFPCTQENKPMISWGWKADKVPELYTKADAKALSPCGYVGQNMLYQPFIVMDIDGVGHGKMDPLVIQFGEMFKNDTLSYEDPRKRGSFHLYFETDRLIPVKHFPHAKLDLMGNAVNAAVYFKHKQSNNKPMLKLTAEIWNMMIEYETKRKEFKHESRSYDE